VLASDPTAAVFGVQPLESLLSLQLAPARFLGWLTGGFAVLALALTVIGMYGLLSYWVRRQRTEIGIRMALGAARGHLLRLVVGQALAMAAAGVVIGGAAAAGLAQLLEAQLFGVGPLDWVSFGGTAVLMLTAAAAASLAPSVRVLRQDPSAALRTDGA
jgi:ABC-type antimicrobial peptide transport system permease subunit